MDHVPLCAPTYAAGDIAVGDSGGSNGPAPKAGCWAERGTAAVRRLCQHRGDRVCVLVCRDWDAGVLAA